MSKKTVQERIAQLDDLLDIQLGFAKSTDKSRDPSADYQQGMYNGMVLAQYVVDDRTSPVPFYSQQNHPRKYRPDSKIRHKQRRK